jgi:4-amino-4-deoxy-L-arabinose transferase-like glycosyltransferase
MPPVSVAQSTSAFARRRRWERWRLLLGPVLVTLAICLPKIWQGDFNVDTGWYAAIALQAYRGLHDVGLESLWALQGGAESVEYFNKPPVAFWLNGLPLAIFGPTIWAARLGSVIAVVLCVVLTTLMVHRFSGAAAARAAGLVLATSIPFVSLGRSFSLDLWLTVFCLGVLWMLVDVGRPLNIRKLGREAPILGLALLVKPFIAILVLPVVGIWFVVVGHWRRSWSLLTTLAAGGALASLWYLWMTSRYGGEFLDQHFGREIVERAAGNRSVATFNAGAESPFYYVVALAESYWPWLLTVLLATAALALRRVPRRKTAQGGARLTDRDWLWLGLIWSAVWLVGLSLFPDKRPRYLAPLFPIWAWMSALWLTRYWGGPASVRHVWRRLARVFPWIAVIAGVTMAALPIQVHKPQDANWRQVMSWIDTHPGASIHAGGFVGQRMAKVYLQTARWPETTTPRAGSYVLYHTRDGLAPGPNEDVVLQADKLLITRLTTEPWSPVPTPDPGE